MRQALPLVAAFMVLLAGAAFVVLLISFDSTDKSASRDTASTKAPTTTTTTTSTITTPNPPPPVQVQLSCLPDGSHPNVRGFVMVAGGDFTPIWVAPPTSCEADRDDGPLTAIEQQALTASGYTDPTSITTLYTLCAVVDPESVYLGSKHSWTAPQIAEVTGMLTLCPGHPQAALLNESIVRSQADAAAAAAGELFDAGTFLVGSEIKPGTYAVEGLLGGCYWERTDRTGEIIDNGFSAGARRIEVTIRSTDYSFHNERCGQWRKVS